MTASVMPILGALRAAFKPKASLMIENLALRQQLAVLRRKTLRPRMTPTDRAFWVVLSEGTAAARPRFGHRRDPRCLGLLRAPIGASVYTSAGSCVVVT